MRAWLLKGSNPYWAGLAFACLIVLVPEILPIIAAPSGMVWTPVRSVNYHPGDLYYYAAYLAEVVQHGIPLYSPTAAEMRGSPVIETWRFMPILLGALPGFIIDDVRAVILVDYVISALLFFSLPYLVARMAGCGVTRAVVAGLATYFLTDSLWVTLPVHPDSLMGIPRWPFMGIAYAGRSMIMASGLVEYDVLGSTFRFVNLSLSGPLLLVYFFAVLKLHFSQERGANVAWLGGLAIFSPVMAFSYPSHALIAYGLLASFATVSFFAGNAKKSVAMLVICALTLILLLAIDYFSILANTLEKSELWKNIFAREKFELRDGGWPVLLAVGLNKYVASFALMLFLTRSNPRLRQMVVGVGLVALPLSMVCLLNTPQLWSRFLGRGIDHIWFMLVVICLLQFAASSQKADVGQTLWGRALRFVAASIVALAFALPVVAFGGLGIRNIENGSRYLPAAKLEAYRWIDSNLPPGANIALLDWEDISLLPIYSHADLVVGHSVVDGRSPSTELQRYVDTWRYFGRSRQALVEMVERSPTAILKDHRLVYHRGNIPLLSAEEFEAAEFMEGVLYWPYVTHVNGTPITEDSADGPMIAAQFRGELLALFDNSNFGRYESHYAVTAVMVPVSDSAAMGRFSTHNLLFRNAEVALFRVPPGHGSASKRSD